MPSLTEQLAQIANRKAKARPEFDALHAACVNGALELGLESALFDKRFVNCHYENMVKLLVLFGCF